MSYTPPFSNEPGTRAFTSLVGLPSPRLSWEKKSLFQITADDDDPEPQTVTLNRRGWYQVDGNETNQTIFANNDTDPEAVVVPEAARQSRLGFDINSEPQSIRLLLANGKPLKPSLKARLLRKEENLSSLDLYMGHPLLIPFKDPLEALPMELWILCIRFALGDSPVHGPLLYAGVCTNWQAKLLETPILWKEICLVNGEDEDARVTTFLQLSQQVPLTVEILAPIHDLMPLSRVLEHGARIESLSFNPYHQKSGLDAWSTSLHSMFSLIIKPGIKYDMLKHIDGTGILTISQAMTITWACPNAKIVSSEEGDKRLPTVPSPFKIKPRIEHAIVQVLLNTSSRRRNVLLTGPPYSGKTSMAAYFMQTYRSLFSFILFVDASSERSIQTGLISAAEPLGLPTSSKWEEVLHSLTQQENPLIVYDNVLGPELLERYLPSGRHSAILATGKELSEEEELEYPWFSIIQVGSVQFLRGDKLENVVVFDKAARPYAFRDRVQGSDEGYHQDGNWFNRFSEDESRALFDIDMDLSSTIPVKKPSLFANVYLETVYLPRTRPLTLRGSILVKNIAFEKAVVLRFTFDEWQTTSEVTCRHVCTLPTLPPPFPLENPIPGIPILTWDRFSFQVSLEYTERWLEERTMFFAARYNVSGFGEWWDNNDGGNYKVLFKKVETSSDGDSTTTNETQKSLTTTAAEESQAYRAIPNLDLEPVTLSSILNHSLPPLKLKL